jgi:hypothetical protein
VLVRPFGEGAQFPGQPGNPPPEGYDITVDLGEDGVLALQFSVDLLQGGGPIYGRYVGALSGTLDGAVLEPGKGVCEEFRVSFGIMSLMGLVDDYANVFMQFAQQP